jgi:hypothetical protein
VRCAGGPLICEAWMQMETDSLGLDLMQVVVRC